MREQFIIIKEKGLDRIALPKANRSVLQCAIKIHKEGTTFKSRFVHTLLVVAAWTGTAAWIPRAQAGSPKRLQDFDLEGWVEYVARRLGHKLLYVSIAFPPKTHEKRFVASLITPTGQGVGFAKVSGDNSTDNQLCTEIIGLGEMGRTKTTCFSVPGIIDSGIYDHHRYLILELLDESHAIRFHGSNCWLEPILYEMSGLCRMKTLVDCSWWHKLERADASVQSLVERAYQRRDRIIPVALSHGDFGVGNTYRCGDKVYLYDWEEFCSDAPRFTDWFCYLMPPAQIQSCRQGQITKLYDMAYKRLQLSYPEITHWDLGLAMLLLSTRRNWVVSSKTTRILSKIICQNGQRDEN